MDRYELSAQIGDGSFGRVLKAKSKETGALVSRVIGRLLSALRHFFYLFCWNLNVSHPPMKQSGGN